MLEKYNLETEIHELEQFLLGDLSRVLHYAELALQAGRLEVTRKLTVDAEKRYGNLVNVEQCNHLYEKSVR